MSLGESMGNRISSYQDQLSKMNAPAAEALKFQGGSVNHNLTFLNLVDAQLGETKIDVTDELNNLIFQFLYSAEPEDFDYEGFMVKLDSYFGINYIKFAKKLSGTKYGYISPAGVSINLSNLFGCIGKAATSNKSGVPRNAADKDKLQQLANAMSIKWESISEALLNE